MNNVNLNLIELTETETSFINAGSPLTEKISYALGYTWTKFANYLGNLSMQECHANFM